MKLDKKISLVSLGCAKNLVDSEILVGGLKKEGFKMVSNRLNLIVELCKLRVVDFEKIS